MSNFPTSEMTSCVLFLIIHLINLFTRQILQIYLHSLLRNFLSSCSTDGKDHLKRIQLVQLFSYLDLILLQLYLFCYYLFHFHYVFIYIISFSPPQIRWISLQMYFPICIIPSTQNE